MTDPSNVDYGTDLSCVFDFTNEMAEVSGRLLLAQACARRLITARGTVLDDLNYGYDLSGELKDDIGPGDVQRIKAAVEAECVKDERVISATATVSFSKLTRALTVSVLLQDGSGPFKFTLAVGGVTPLFLMGGGT